MGYQYKKFQLFKKKLAIPKRVREGIYNSYATIDDFIEYNLAHKIPIEYLREDYRIITQIVGIDKALGLDWECILALKKSYKILMDWFKENNEIYETAEELNKGLYESIKEDFMDKISRKDGAYLRLDRLIDSLETEVNQFHFEILGEKFAKTYPELLYVTNFYDARKLFFKELTLANYIHDYERYIKVPQEFIMQSLSNDTDKKLFAFLGASLNSRFIKEEEFLLGIVFNNRLIYDHYDKYLEIININPKMSIPEFLLQAYKKRIKDHYSLEPKTGVLFAYNYNKIANYTHQNTYDIIQMPEYGEIVLQFIKNMPFTLNKDFETIEQFIYDLIIQYHLKYDDSLPVEFQEKYPELFLEKNSSLTIEFYQKRLNPEMIKKHPEFIELLKDKNITVGFQDFEFIQFIKRIGNAKFFDLCLKYGKYLEPLLFKNDGENLEEVLEKSILNKLKNGQYKFYEDLLQIPSIASQVPEFFLVESCPMELKVHFYNHDLTAKMIYENPEWCSYLLNKEIKFSILEKERILYDLAGKNDYLNLCKSYGKYLSKMCLNTHWINCFEALAQMKAPLAEVIDEKVYTYIFIDHVPYDEKLPLSFKEKYPQLFLPADTPNAIKEKFYNRTFKPLDFCNQPNLYQYFQHINVIHSLDKKFSWITQYKRSIENETVIKLALVYDKIEDHQFRDVFQKYALNNMEFLSFAKMDLITDLFFKMSYSNSEELNNCKNLLARKLFQVDNPKKSLEKIEEIFLKNNLPYIGKVFSVFKILHSNYDFNFSEFSEFSPMLKNSPLNLKNANLWGENI